MPNSGFSWGPKLSEIADAVWTRSERSLTSWGADLNEVANAVWVWGDRTLTQAKFPFWSSIITQVQGSISIPASTETYLNIQPLAGETWLVTISIDFPFDYVAFGGVIVEYYDYDGTTRRIHAHNNTNLSYATNEALIIQYVLTNALYASIGYYNTTSNNYTAYYGYSGFKLSQPQWSSQKIIAQEIPFKRPVSVVAFPQLAQKAYLKPDNKVAYHLITEVLAIDPVKNVPVETVEYHVLEEDLIKKLKTFKANPKETGWEKLFNL